MYYVVVNKHVLRANRKNGTNDPVFRISRGRYGHPYYQSTVEFPSGCRLVNNPFRPLPCGASVYMEAEKVA